MQSKSLRMTLRTKLMVLLWSLSIISIAITASVAFFSSSHFFKQSTADSLDGLANLKLQVIDNFIKDRIDQVEKTASSSDLNANLEKAPSEIKVKQQSITDTELKSSEPQIKEGIFEEIKLPQRGKVAKEKLEKSPEYQALNKALNIVVGDGTKYEELFVLNTSGMVVVSTLYENEGKSAQDANFFINGIKTTFIQDPFISDITKKLSMVIATPIKDVSGKVIGVLGARLNLDKFYQIIKDETGLGKTGETIVAKKINDKIVFMGPTRYDDKAALNQKAVVLGSKEAFALQEATRGQEGYGFYKDYRGVETIAVWRHIPSLDWGLVVKMDAKEALEPILNTRNLIAALAIVLVVLVVFLSSYISKEVVGPILELTHAANSISKGNTDVKITIKSNDEVGDLADSFERMLAAIRFLKEKGEEK